MASLAEIKKLSYKYPGSGSNILNGISLTIYVGEIVAVMGLSGSGKSTLCYCLTGIIPKIYGGDIRGEIIIGGRNMADLRIPEVSARVGIVFQNPDSQLFSPTVEDEIAFGPENLCLEREEIGRRINKSLKLVGMERYRFAHPMNLSGGEKQLIAIASVLAMDPGVIVFDESLSHLDSESTNMVKNVILKLKESGRAIFMVEHDRKNIDIADRIYILENGKLFVSC